MLVIYIKQNGIPEKSSFLYEYKEYVFEIKKDFNIEIKSMYDYDIILYIEGIKYILESNNTLKLTKLFKCHTTDMGFMDLGYYVNTILNITVNKKDCICECLNENIIYSIKFIKYL